MTWYMQLGRMLGPGAPVAALFLVMWFVVVEPERQYARTELKAIREQNIAIREQFLIVQERLAVLTSAVKDMSGENLWSRHDQIEWAELLDAMNPMIDVPIPR